MTYRPRRACRVCGIDRDKCGGLSRAGNCASCGAARLAANARALANKSGPEFVHWLNSTSRALDRLWVGALPPDPGLAKIVRDVERVNARYPVRRLQG